MAGYGVTSIDAHGATGPVRTRVVHVAGSGSSGVTVTDVDLERLSVRIHHWIRPEEETNGHLPTVLPAEPVLTVPSHLPGTD